MGEELTFVLINAALLLSISTLQFVSFYMKTF